MHDLQTAKLQATETPEKARLHRGAMERVPPDYTVKPVHRAVQILKAVAASHVPVSLRRVSEIVGLPKSTVFRHLRTLSAEGLILHDRERDQFAVDPAMLSLLPLNGRVLRLREAALPHMKDLNESFAAAIKLSVPKGTFVRCVETVGPHYRAGDWGQRHPLHATASGRSVLAFMTPEVRARAMAPVPAELTRSVEKDAEIVRCRGFAEEKRGQLAIIAAPIFDARGIVIASLAAELVTQDGSIVSCELPEKLSRAADAIGAAVHDAAEPA